MGEIIKLENGQLRVPDYPTIPFIKGDGIGPEIWAAAQPVFDAAVKKVYGGNATNYLAAGLSGSSRL